MSMHPLSCLSLLDCREPHRLFCFRPLGKMQACLSLGVPFVWVRLISRYILMRGKRNTVDTEPCARDTFKGDL